MKIAFDVEQMKPGCVLLQAALGCDHILAHRFPAESWILSPTPNLRVYEVTEEQVPMLVEKVMAHQAEPRSGE